MVPMFEQITEMAPTKLSNGHYDLRKHYRNGPCVEIMQLSLCNTNYRNGLCVIEKLLEMVHV